MSTDTTFQRREAGEAVHEDRSGTAPVNTPTKTVLEDFVSNGRAIKFSVDSGRVLPGQQKTTKTHISSSGGGGYLHQGSGFVDAAKIKSTTTTEQEFWLLGEGGRQIPVRLSGDTMAVNVDQQISVLQARHPKSDKQFLVGIVNHSAGATNWILMPLTLAQKTGLVGWWRAGIMALLSFLLLGAVTGGTALGLIPAAVIVYRYYKKEKAIVTALAEHLGRLAQSLMDRPPSKA